MIINPKFNLGDRVKSHKFRDFMPRYRMAKDPYYSEGSRLTGIVEAIIVTSDFCYIPGTFTVHRYTDNLLIYYQVTIDTPYIQDNPLRRWKESELTLVI